MAWEGTGGGNIKLGFGDLATPIVIWRDEPEAGGGVGREYGPFATDASQSTGWSNAVSYRKDEANETGCLRADMTGARAANICDDNRPVCSGNCRPTSRARTCSSVGCGVVVVARRMDLGLQAPTVAARQGDVAGTGLSNNSSSSSSSSKTAGSEQMARGGDNGTRENLARFRLLAGEGRSKSVG